MGEVIQVHDLADERICMYAERSETQLLRFYEPNPGIFIAESPNVILRALNAGYEPLSLLMEDGDLREDTKTVIEACGDITVYAAPGELLHNMIGYQLTRGILCAMRRKVMPTVTDLCADAKRIAILEEVVNPTNVGAIFRSAAALGVDGVILTAGCSDPLYRRAARVSMGTVFQVPWTKLDKNSSMQELMGDLKQNGFRTVAMALKEDSRSIADPEICSAEKLAIVLGTEGEGLAETTITDCDYTVMIPMTHGVDSLNVAAASAVAFWQLCLQK